METEQVKKENSNDTSIALIQKDIEYMRGSMTKMENAVLMLDKNFARKEDFVNFEKQVAEMIVGVKKDIELKVNISDFAPIRKTLYRINWMVISAVVGAILLLLLKVKLPA